MTQRREIEARVALYEDLSGILGAMRSFALAELHRVTRREAAQQQVVAALADSLGDIAPFLAPQEPTSADVWLLLGSVRGFCGSFNEDVVGSWRQAGKQHDPVIAVGERLVTTMPELPHLLPVAGADGGLDSALAIDRIIAAFAQASSEAGGPCGLVACLRDEDGPRTQRLLPLPVVPSQDPSRLVTNEPLGVVAAGVAEHFLFHQLLALLLRSIRVENRQRLMQMESALRHLERSGDELTRQRNRLRQEEIVEEIEVMTSLPAGSPNARRRH